MSVLVDVHNIVQVTVSSYRVQVLVNLHNIVQVDDFKTKKEAMTRTDRFNFTEKSENDGAGRQAG